MHCVVSIDIGVKNLGWALINHDNDFHDLKHADYKQLKLAFGVYNIDDRIKSSDDIVTQRCACIKHFFNEISAKYTIDYVIIERQVPSNTKAMELMYAITSMALSYVAYTDVIIFTPSLKFTLLQMPYNTKGKAHKILSIDNCCKLLQSIASESLVNAFNKHDKRDDIADSFNQCLVWLSNNGKISLTLNTIRDICVHA